MNCARLLALLSVLGLFFNGCNKSMPGSYSAAAVNDVDVVAAAEFAVAEESKKGNSLSLVSIDAAKKQVVAGMNYRVSLTVKDSGASRKAEAVIYRDIESNLSLTAWTWNE